MKTFYVITFINLNKFACDDDGFLNCANSGLYSYKLYETREKAIEARTRLIQEEVEKENSNEGCYPKEDDFHFEISDLNADSVYIDVYLGYHDELINETVCTIEKVDLY